MPKKAKKPALPSLSTRMTALENVMTATLGTFQQFKQMLGTKAIENLTERVGQLENLFKPEMQALLGELRAVRYLLDDKKQYAHMDKPKPPLGEMPLAEGPVAPSVAEGPSR
jgi:hypothetical protein